MSQGKRVKKEDVINRKMKTGMSDGFLVPIHLLANSIAGPSDLMEKSEKKMG